MLDTVHQRLPFLEAIHESDTDRKRLQRDLDVSRSTVDRAIDTLSELEIVTVDDRRIQATLLGKLLANGYKTFASNVSEIYGQHQPTDTVYEIISTIQNRERVLEQLYAESKDKRSLVAEIPASRSTVNRGVRDVESLDLITYEDGEFHLTREGRFLYTRWRSFRSTVESIDEARPLLVHLPPDADISTALLRGSEVILSPELAPHMVGTHLEGEIEDAIRGRVLARANSHARAMETVLTQVTDHGLELEIILSADLCAYLRRQYPRQFSILSDHCDIRSSANVEIPYGLFLLEQVDDEIAYLLVYSSGNDLRGAIVNDTPPALNWAERVYGQHQTEATWVSQTELPPDADAESSAEFPRSTSQSTELTNRP
jgi:predicted transcriptional regulator